VLKAISHGLEETGNIQRGGVPQILPEAAKLYRTISKFNQ
jgi:hypothetical protein